MHDNKISIKEKALTTNDITIIVDIDGVEYTGHAFDALKVKLLRDILDSKHNDYTIETISKKIIIKYKSYSIDKSVTIPLYKAELYKPKEDKIIIEQHPLISNLEAKEIINTLKFKAKHDTSFQLLSLKYKGRKFRCCYYCNPQSLDVLEKIMQDIKSGTYTNYTLTTVRNTDRSAGLNPVWYEIMDLTITYNEHTIPTQITLQFEHRITVCVIL